MIVVSFNKALRSNLDLEISNEFCIATAAKRGGGGGGGAVAQSVERATPGEEVPGSIPAVAARSLLVGSVSV